MINALLQRLLTLGVPLLCWSLAWWLWPTSPNYAWAWLVAPALVTIVLLAVQFLILFVVNRADATPRASVFEHTRAWWGEVRACMRVFHWWQPFWRTAYSDNLNVREVGQSQRGVVLLHGFFCNRAFWTHWLQRLQSEQRVFVAVDLEPAFGSIDEYVDAVEHAVQQVWLATGRAPVIVGHSMGGLAARAWLVANAAKDTGPTPVHRVITLGTPHHGTWLARFSHTQNGAQMQSTSKWLAKLQEDEKKLQKVQFTCFFSNCDNIVFPVSSAKLDGADNRLVLRRGHIDMVHDPQVIDACWALMQ